MPAPPSIRVKLRDIYHKSIRDYFAARRARYLNQLINGIESAKSNGRLKLLEIGCANGLDFMQFANEDKFDLYGVDNRDFSKQLVKEFNFLCCDAENLQFDDNFFDLAISIGVLEHIKPIQKLDKITQEISRVAKKFIVVVPSNGTWLEPHRIQFNWQKRPPGKKIDDEDLFYYSDEAWTQFTGFLGAETSRYSYMPFLINNLIITNIK